MEERIGELDIFMKRHISFTELAAQKYPDLKERVEQSMREEELTGRMPYIDHGPTPPVEELLNSHEHRAVNYGFNPDELEERVVQAKKLREGGNR